MTTANPTGTSDAVFPGDSEMAARCRAFDWSTTPLGPVETWSQSLRTTVSTLLASRHPMFLWWGPELVQIYNDAYRPSFGEGDRHPRALGARGREFWTDIWDTIGPQIEQVMSGGAATWHEDQYLPIERNGRIDDVWWTYGYSPVRDDDGRVGGTLVVCQETTTRVRALAERDRLLESMTDAFAAFDDDWRYTFVNAEAERLLGRPREALLGRVVWDVFPEARVGPAWDSAVTARNEQRVVEYEFFLAAIGKWVRARNYPLPGGGIAAVFLDVTAERERETQRDRLLALAESRAAELAAVIRSMPDAVYIGTADGITIANEAALAQLGYERLEDLGRPVGTLAAEVHTRDEATGEVIPGDRQAFSRALRGERVVQNVIVRHRATGEDRVVRCAAAPVVVDGRVVAAVAVNTDVTEQRSAAVERERLAAAMESSADFIGIASPDGQALYVNEAGRRMVGLPDMDAVRRTRIADYFFPEDQAFVEGTILPGMRAGRWRGETRFRHFVTGAAVPVLYDAFRVTDPRTGALIGYGTVTRDLTERDQLLRDADAARTEAESANRAKSDFLAVMSHELRTPLNAIGGYAELLELGIRGPVTAEQRQDLARIQKSQRHLLGLINEVLNYTRVESGAVTYDVGDVLLDETLATCEALTSPQMRAKRLTYQYEGCDPALTVRADSEKLQQIVLNLLTNSIKFTEPGGRVTVRCDVADDHATVTVHDTGRGIAADQLERVFEPFVQVDARLTRTKEGVGLGLAISRDLARGMGGDLTAESKVGVGSSFRLTLPR
ncbi:MAG TPA: PAS domain-containing protein [Gemmatimonadaceae bacterium]|nr:PAS domain-containing protein [Gemmatimonadaceae bacterium]